MRNYLGLAPEKDRGYAYVIIFCASLWSGFFLGYVVNFQLLTAQWKLSLGLFRWQWCWWHLLNVGGQNGQNRQQYLIIVTNALRLQHPSPTSMLPSNYFKKFFIWLSFQIYHLKQRPCMVYSLFWADTPQRSRLLCYWTSFQYDFGPLFL